MQEPSRLTMACKQVKLFGVWESPFSKRVEIALKMKGVEYEYVEEDLKNKSPSILKYNPVHKQVPVFLHNGNPIVESLVILEYIDETWKSGLPLLPTDPHQRATSRFWAKFIDEKCLSAIMKIMHSQGAEQEKAIDEAGEFLKVLENELKGKKFFGGESVGFVDIVSNIIGYWIGVVQEVMGLELLTKEKYPKLSEWIDDYLNDSIIKTTLPPRADLLAYFQEKFQPINDSK